MNWRQIKKTNKTYSRNKRWGDTPLLILLALSFLLNYHIMNEKKWMKVLVFIYYKFSIRFELKNWDFSTNPHRKNKENPIFTQPCVCPAHVVMCIVARGINSYAILPFSSFFWVLSSSKLVFGLGTDFQKLVISS